MCVIMVVEEGRQRPSLQMCQKAWGRNDHGGGFAYRVKIKGKTYVKWEKNLSARQMEQLCETAPLPYVAHWRIASCGGILPELTHPFVIDPVGKNEIKGVTDRDILFHNGTWKGWEDAVRYAAGQTGTKIPVGKWSDTRAIAWLMSIYGNGFMELLPDQRGVAFGPENLDVFTGPGWVEVNGVLCSNAYFMSYELKKAQNEGQSAAGLLMAGNGCVRFCTFEGCSGTNLDTDQRCVRHPKASFPTNKAPEVAGAKPLPFQIISLAQAEALFARQSKTNRPYISKSSLKFIRKMYVEMADGGKRGEAAKAALGRVSIPLLRIVDSLKRMDEHS